MPTPTLEDKKRRRESRRQMEDTVGTDFKALIKQYPNESVTCLFETLAGEYRKQKAVINYHKQDDTIVEVKFPTTGAGVRNILERNGIYKSQQGQ